MVQFPHKREVIALLLAGLADEHAGRLLGCLFSDVDKEVILLETKGAMTLQVVLAAMT